MSQFRLVSIKIKGFRGFPEQGGEREFKFDGPCTLLFGTQGAAKSSALHAVEWCLFGEKVAKATESGIQERKGWLVRNKRSAEASVEVVFEQDGQLRKVHRSDRKARGSPGFSFQRSLCRLRGCVGANSDLRRRVRLGCLGTAIF